jgi:hypothetical protein
MPHFFLWLFLLCKQEKSTKYTYKLTGKAPSEMKKEGT